MKYVRALLVFMLLVLFGSSTGFGQDREDIIIRRAPLQGLPGVRVVVEEVPEFLVRAGLSTHRFQTLVEVRLRQARIRVLPADSVWAYAGSPNLYLNTIALEGTGAAAGLCVYGITLEFREAVTLWRSSNITVPATTWHATGVIGVVGMDRLRSIESRIAAAVDEFINDYLAINPT